jgi:DNA-binding CsgD family transcriptional regulator
LSKLFVYGENEDCDILDKYIEGDIQDAEVLLAQAIPFKEEQCSVSVDGERFKFVEKEDLWNYPIVEINQYDDGDYHGVNRQGISLLAFDINAEPNNELEINLQLYPSYISTWKNKIQIIFKLKDFIPIDIASEQTKEFLKVTINVFETRQNCTNTNELINPFCKDVKSYIFNPYGLSLGEIMHAAYYPVNAEHKKLVKAKGGKAAAKVRGEKSQDKIRNAIQVLKITEGLFTQNRIAEFTGLSRKTVNKHWKTITDKE